MKKKLVDFLTFLDSGGIERWWIGLGLSKKKEAALKAIFLYLGINAIVFSGNHILRLVFTSPIGHWLELDRKPGRPYVPGTLILMQILFLIGAVLYYRDKVKRL